MADSAIAVTAGSGTNIDTRTEATNGDHRQVVVIGDPSTTAGVAPVDGTKGLAVQIVSAGVASGAIASGAVASGAFASGALASGSVASGAFASGSIASGAIAAGAIATGATSIAANEDDASNNADTGVKVLAVQKATPANTATSDGDYEFLQISAGKLWVAPLGFPVTVTTDVARPGDTTAYTANDAWSDSTTAPTSGGFTFTGAARKSGGSGIITDAVITTSGDATTLLQGEIWLFNQAVTNIDDNAAFAVTDAEIKTYVGKIPFLMEDSGNNGSFHAQKLNIMFTCSGSANLRYLIKVKNAYTPVSSEVLTVTLKILQID